MARCRLDAGVDDVEDDVGEEDVADVLASPPSSTIFNSTRRRGSSGEPRELAGDGSRTGTRNGIEVEARGRSPGDI